MVTSTPCSPSDASRGEARAGAPREARPGGPGAHLHPSARGGPKRPEGWRRFCSRCIVTRARACPSCSRRWRRRGTSRNTNPVARGMLDYLECHILEEREHAQWLLEDLEVLGVSAAEVLARAPAVSAAEGGRGAVLLDPPLTIRWPCAGLHRRAGGPVPLGPPTALDDGQIPVTWRRLPHHPRAWKTRRRPRALAVPAAEIICP